MTTTLATESATLLASEECGACHAFFPTLDEVFSHTCPAIDGLAHRPRLGEVIARRGDHETVGNGFGGTTTRKVEAIVPPTEKQVPYLRSLLTERAGNETAEAIRNELNAHREAGTLSKRIVSKAIDALLKIARPIAPFTSDPKPSTTTRPQVAPLPEVPEGRYALETEDGVKFYLVECPAEGKWAGWTFVKVMASDDLWPIKGEARRPILEAIAADLAAAAGRYGILIRKCGYCSRKLTHFQSRAAGYGSDCADHHGLWYPTPAEARAILTERGEAIE